MQSNNHRLVLLVLLWLGCWSAFAQEDGLISLPIKAEKDTLIAPLYPQPIQVDTLVKDSTVARPTSRNQEMLLDKIRYKAKDSIHLSQREQKIYLYNEAEIYYQDTELKAGIIVMDYVKNEVYAGRLKDSLGNYTQLPFFKQGDNEVRPDSIRFNFDTEKALIFNSRTEQQAGLGQLGSDAMKVYA
ncbi:MAG: LPS-assembly protein LptD, partial [Pricia sp.]